PLLHRPASGKTSIPDSTHKRAYVGTHAKRVEKIASNGRIGAKVVPYQDEKQHNSPTHHDVTLL
ncbi:MAG: hypothetical protein WAN81_22745, partial [Candidatus Binataceae bacterium]